MKNYIIYFEGTTTEAEAKQALAGYCTFLSFKNQVTRVTTDDPERLELHLEQVYAVERYKED